MKLLAFDTSTEACSAALYDEGKILRRHEIAPRRHTELILPMLEGLLAEGGFCLQDLDGLAFGRGPGAFTGVRIASGVVQGLALAADLPVAPVSSMAAMARQMYRRLAAEQVLIAIDARMGEVYCGVYRCLDGGRVETLASERVCHPEQLHWPPTGGGHWFGAGTGWGCHAKALGQTSEAMTRVLPDIYPDASDIASLGALLLKQGSAVAAEAALPVYLRDEVIQGRPPSRP